MKRLVASILTFLASGTVMAQDSGPIVMAPAQPLLMTIVLLFAAAGCVVFSFQVFMLVRGGQLSRTWIVFSGGFLLLAASQIMIILTGFGFVGYNDWMVPAILTAMAGLFIWGLWETKKVLS